jgi:salicylate hydroxylase
MTFEKQLMGYEDESGSDRVVLADGIVADAHALFGCNGIHSTARKLLLGADHPASRPTFSHVVAYRTMVPIEKEIETLGAYKAMSACMYCAPDVNMMWYPVRAALDLLEI